MAIAQGSCPNCGAPIEFALGASLAKVCEFCNFTVVRTDRGLEHLGKVAALANTPSLVAVGDEGTLARRPFKIMGRVQLDHGLGPWDEYYLSLNQGAEWGWLAYAEGQWQLTYLAPDVRGPTFAQLTLDQDVDLGAAGRFRVNELKSATIVSAEGELPEKTLPGSVRFYADLSGPQNRFATLDYGPEQGAPEAFVGITLTETELQVTAAGPRSVQKIKTTSIRCPNCGGDVPKLSGERAQRLGCPYCGALSDITTQKVVATQEAAAQKPDIAVGSQGSFEGVPYICAAYLRRATEFEGEPYSWEEYLLFAPGVGFRWLVKDPETGWAWISPVNSADIDHSGSPRELNWEGRNYRQKYNNRVRVEYVLGEVYWQCSVGEETRSSDYVVGRFTLSREESPGEVRYSSAKPMAWGLIAQAFGLPLKSAGADTPNAAKSGGTELSGAVIAFIVIVVVLIVVVSALSDGTDGGYGAPVSGFSRGSGIFFGGK